MENVFNHMSYGNLRFRQVGGGGGGAGPDPANKVTVNGLIWNLVPIIAFSTFTNMTSQRLPFHKGEQVIAIRYLTPGIKQNSKKILFMANKYLLYHKISMFFKRNNKIYMLTFSRTFRSKNNCSSPSC